MNFLLFIAKSTYIFCQLFVKGKKSSRFLQKIIENNLDYTKIIQGGLNAFVEKKETFMRKLLKFLNKKLNRRKFCQVSVSTSDLEKI